MIQGKILLEILKEVYLCGDFNSDLLKLDSVNNYKNFYELVCSYGYLPQILQPTRIQGDSATIITTYLLTYVTAKSKVAILLQTSQTITRNLFLVKRKN